MVRRKPRWLQAVVLCVAISFVCTTGHTDDIESTLMLQGDLSRQPVRIKLGESASTRTGGAMTAKSSFHAGAFDYSIMLEPGNTVETRLGDSRIESRPLTVPPLQLERLRRALEASVAQDGSIERRQTLAVVFGLTQAHSQQRQGRRLLNGPAPPERGPDPDQADADKEDLLELHKLEAEERKNGIKPRDNNAAALEAKVAKAGLKPKREDSPAVTDEGPEQEAQELANELHTKADEQLAAAKKENKHFTEELRDQNTGVQKEARAKKRKEMGFKKANELKVKQQSKEQAGEEKKVKTATKKAQGAEKKAEHIKEVLSKATEADQKYKAQETKAKEAHLKFVKLHQEQREKSIAVRRAQMAAIVAEKRKTEEAELSRTEKASKVEKESQMKNMHAMAKKKLQHQAKLLKKEIAKKTVIESKGKTAAQAKMKAKYERDNKETAKVAEKHSKEHQSKMQHLLKGQQKKKKQLELDSKRDNKEAIEQNQKKKEGMVKAQEKADKQLKRIQKDLKARADKEFAQKKQVADAMKRADDLVQQKEKGSKEKNNKNEMKESSEERVSKKTASERRQKSNKSALDNSKRLELQAAAEHKTKVETLDKQHKKEAAERRVALRVAEAKKTQADKDSKSFQLGLKKSEVSLKTARSLNRAASKKSNEMVKTSKALTAQAKELGSKVKKNLGRARCKLSTYMGVLRANDMLGTQEKKPCKISCNLDTGLTHTLKIPCFIKSGKKNPACQLQLHQRATSLASLGMVQFDKYTECQLPRKAAELGEENSPSAGMDHTRVSFASLMGALMGWSHKGLIQPGVVIDQVMQPVHLSGLGEDPSVEREPSKDLVTRMAEKAMARRRSVPYKGCDVTLKIAQKLRNTPLMPTKGCTLKCKVNVPSMDGYDAECTGDGDEKCFLDAQISFHRKVAEEWFGWKTHCLSV